MADTPDFIPIGKPSATAATPDFIPIGKPVAKTTAQATKPGYSTEVGQGIARGVSNIAGIPKSILQSAEPRTVKEGMVASLPGGIGNLALGIHHQVHDVLEGLNEGAKARHAAQRGGEGIPGQILSTLEKYPLIGPIVEHAESGGTKTANPQSIGAATEGISTYLAGKSAEGIVKAGGRASDYIGLKSRSGQAFNHIESKIPDAPVNHEPLQTKIAVIDDLGQKGFPIPKVVNDLRNWLQTRSSSHLAPGPGGLIDSPGSMSPLRFKDARDFYTAFNEEIDWDEIKGGRGGKMGRQVLGLRNELGKELMQTAQDQGYGNDYGEALRGYHKALKAESMAGPIGYVAGKLGGIGAGAVVGHPYLAAYAGGKLGGSVAGSMVRSITEAGAEDRITPNASGESMASQEAINRVGAEKAGGIKRYRIDTRSGKKIPLIGVDAVDAKAGPYDVIVKEHPGGKTELVDRGQQARN